jgi:hypothetical protein
MPEPIIDNLNRLKVTDKNGNAYVLLPVDTEARQEIEEAKNIQFDSSFFTAEEDAVNGEVNVGLNGVPIGVSSPLRFDQDTAQGIVIGIDTSAVTPAEMTGATASTDGTSGLVPAPDAGDQDKFLKGDGTWTNPPEVNLGQYYYDYENTGLSARRTSGRDGLPFSQASLVGCGGNVNNYTVDMALSLHWGNAARTIFYINTTSENSSFIRFGIGSGEQGYRYLLPRPVANRVAMTDANKNIVWGTISPYAPEPSADNTLLLGDASGDKAWTPLLRGAFGTPLLDEDDEPLLDEQTGKPVYDANATSDLWTSFADHGFGAQRSYGDQDGNNIKATYATKAELSDVADGLDTALDTLNDTMEAVAHAGMYDLGTKTESDLDDGALAISCGNSTTELELTTRSTLTVLANPGVANFALLVDNTGNSNDVTVTVKDSTGANTFYQSTAAGNTVGAGKICQVTCVGKCWTLAEFELPGA